MNAEPIESSIARTGSLDRERAFCIVTMCTAFGGLEKHTLRLARTLQDRGHAVTILQWGVDICSRVPSSELSGIDVVPPPAVDMARATLLDLWRALEKYRGWIGVFPKGWYLEGSLGFDLVARATFRRFITIEHSCASSRPALDRGQPILGVLPRPGLWWYRQLWRERLRGVGPHLTVCVSNAVRRGLIDTCRFSQAKLLTIVNGVDTKVFSRNDIARDVHRKRLGVDARTLLFGVVGRLNRDKNVALAVRAFAGVMSAGPPRDARLLIVGEGESSDSLRGLARQLGVADKIVFEGFSDRVQNLCAAIDVLLLPSLKEGLPLALLEAMSCECTAIANAVGGVPEVLSDPDFGSLVPGSDEDAFQRAMWAALHESPAAVAEAGRKARRHVIARFDATVQFSALADALEQRADPGVRTSVSSLSTAAARPWP